MQIGEPLIPTKHTIHAFGNKFDILLRMENYPPIPYTRLKETQYKHNDQSHFASEKMLILALFIDTNDPNFRKIDEPITHQKLASNNIALMLYRDTAEELSKWAAYKQAHVKLPYAHGDLVDGIQLRNGNQVPWGEYFTMLEHHRLTPIPLLFQHPCNSKEAYDNDSGIESIAVASDVEKGGDGMVQQFLNNRNSF